MLTVNKLIPQGRGLAPALLKRAAGISLDWATRQLKRFEASDANGRRLVCELPAGSTLRGGDVLVAEDGSLLRVQAALQPVLVVRACAEHTGGAAAIELLRAAYQLGQRHVVLEMQAQQLLLEPDAELERLLQSWHLSVSTEQAAFEPTPAPSGGEHGHAHEHHGHGHGHEHAHHAHEHEHEHDEHESHAHAHHGHEHHDHRHGDDDAHHAHDTHAHAHPHGKPTPH